MFLYSIAPLYAVTPWLHTDANEIKDPNGNVVVLRGIDTIDIGATEVWYGGVIELIDRVTDKTDTQGSSSGWYPRVIRLAVYPKNEDSFTGGPWYFEDDHDAYYNDLLRPIVDYCKTKDLYAIIDWHYVGDNTWDRITETSTFWEYMAPKFANDSHVLFELFNEPLNTSPGDETADWLSVRTDMQTWIDIIRGHAPNNLILVAGSSWSQVIGPAASYPLTGNNIVMVTHLYPAHWKGVYGDPEYFKNHVRQALTVYPVFATEWGFWGTSEELLDGTITDYGQPIMDFYEELKISNSAWCASYAWSPPMFYSDWTLRVGEDEMGGFVKDTLYARRNDDQPGGGDTIPPTAPTGLAAIAAEGMVSLHWDDNNEVDLDGYNVYRSTTSGGGAGGYDKLNSSLLTDPNYTDNDIIGDVTYYYVVTAVDTSLNESDDSNEVSATPTDTTPPSVPTGLTATPGSEMVSLDWNDNPESDLDGYNVYRSTTSGGGAGGYDKLNSSLLTSSDYTDSNVISGTTYYYVVTAIDKTSNESRSSSEVSAIPNPPSTDVEIIGDWTSGLSHTEETGTNRALILIAHAEENGDVSLNSVKYGGQTMTKVIDRVVSSGGYYAYVVAYILDEAGIAAANDSNFVPTWSSPRDDEAYASVFLQNVDQTAPVGATASNSSTTTGTNITITTDALATGDGDMVIDAATCGNTGNYTVNNAFTEALEHDMDSSTGTDGYKFATGVDETPSVTHSNVNRQVIIGFVVQAGGEWLYGDLTYDNKVDVNDLSEFCEVWLVEDCNNNDILELDLDDDCVINFYEYSLLAQNWLEEI